MRGFTTNPEKMIAILFKRLLISMKKHEVMNRNIKLVNLEILKVKTWFGDEGWFS